jgi:acetyl esterase/lipase
VPLQELEPSIAALVNSLDMDTLSAESFRRYRFPFPNTEPPTGMVRTEHQAPGDPSVALKIHRPASANHEMACIYMIHGGGYVIGSYDMDDARLDRWCPALGVIGVSVDYRLAPETPYPGPLEDCYQGLKWVHDHASELGIDVSRLGLVGGSAGGGLAAALSLLARDRGEIPVGFALLDCPMLDDRQRTASSQADGLPVWSRESNAFGWRSYLGDLYGTENVPYLAAPSRCDDLAGLPPTFVSVGTVDGFRDEDTEYATRLNQAGVPCELHVYPGACHGYQMAVDSVVTQQAEHDALRWLGRQLGR